VVQGFEVGLEITMWLRRQCWKPDYLFSVNFKGYVAQSPQNHSIYVKPNLNEVLQLAPFGAT